jgi:hypothetical protein
MEALVPRLTIGKGTFKMSAEPRDKYFGDSISEWCEFLPNELEDIGVGLVTIVQTGRYGFELKDSDLINFVRKSLYALVERGAKPRQWGSFSHPNRDIPLHYGNDTNEEIVEGVIADWLASGAGDLEWGDFWFALPGTIDD